MKYELLNGHSAELLKKFPDNHFDSIVTDPPYLIGFLGKSWDAADNFQLDVYQECLRVLKPGGHILAFSAARTYHHLAVTLEQAGFEIRDQIMWIYSSGFPKSQDVGKSIDKKAGIKHDYVDYHRDQDDTRSVSNNANAKNRHCKKCNKQLGTNNLQCNESPCPIKNPPIQSEWAGWGTALKPAHEPIALARKPIKTSIAKNAQKWGTGALNIDGCRVGDDVITTIIKQNKDNVRWYGDRADGQDIPKEVDRQDNVGRFPSNVIGEIQEEYQKYFYCPKVSRKERHIGFDDPGAMFPGSRFDVYMPTADKTNPETTIKAVEEKLKDKGNNHPTVKPVELMKYLIKLVTPPGGKILDPFNGSGSTGMAAVELGFEYVGIDLDEHYIDIATKRIDAWYKQTNPLQASGLFE